MPNSYYTSLFLLRQPDKAMLCCRIDFFVMNQKFLDLLQKDVASTIFAPVYLQNVEEMKNLSHNNDFWLDQFNDLVLAIVFQNISNVESNTSLAMVI